MFFEYLGAAMKHWLTIIFGILGSSPWWLRALLSDPLKKKIDNILDPSAMRILGITCIFIAFIAANYLTWNEEHQKVVQLTNKQDTAEENKRIVADLSEFISQATAIQVHCEGYKTDHTPADPNANTDAEFREWNARVHNYLDTNLGHSYVQRLEDNSATPVTVSLRIPEKHRLAFVFVEQRKAHLREFIKKFE
jgi:hypothetical protein